MSNNVEIELKFTLLNGPAVARFLDEHADFQYKSFQHDVYYNAPHRDFLENPTNISEWLRIRIEEDKAQVNYKDWQPRDNPVKTHCKEYETDVSSYGQLSLILDALGFKQLVEVKKTRKAWMYKDVEVSLDSVEELGDYIELEYKGGEVDNIENVREYLHSIAAALGVKAQKPDLNGYPFGLLKKKGLLSR